jgi:hypothetical protein
MNEPTFDLQIRSSSFADSVLETLKIENKKYTILGCVQGEQEFGYTDAYYVLMLVKDILGKQYLISTADYIPNQIVNGSRDEILNQKYYDWEPGGEFYLDLKRENLVWASTIKLDNKNNWYKLK